MTSSHAGGLVVKSNVAIVLGFDSWLVHAAILWLSREGVRQKSAGFNLVFGSFFFRSFYILEYRQNFARNFRPLFCDSKEFRNMVGTRAYFGGNVLN